MRQLSIRLLEEVPAARLRFYYSSGRRSPKSLSLPIAWPSTLLPALLLCTSPLIVTVTPKSFPFTTNSHYSQLPSMSPYEGKAYLHTLQRYDEDSGEVNFSLICGLRFTIQRSSSCWGFTWSYPSGYRWFIRAESVLEELARRRVKYGIFSMDENRLEAMAVIQEEFDRSYARTYSQLRSALAD